MEDKFPFDNKVHKNGTSKIKDEEKTSPWKWMFGNFSLIFIALFLILPFGLYKTWGTGAEWVPIISFVLIGTISFIAGTRNYKQLVRMGYIKKFWE